MRRKSIPWFAPETDREEVELVLRVLRSNYINDGDISRLFETKIAKLLGVTHCVAVTSGTAALTLALMGLGIGPQDEVIVPDLTFIATANAVRLTGATVKLVDIEPQRFTINLEKLVSLISHRTRAIVPVDVNGRGADYKYLEAIAKEKGLFLVSDSTEGLGSQWRGRYLGTFGDAGCFSFSPNKTITTGQGGMIATNNTKLYYRLLELKDHGRRIQGSGGNDLHPVLGFNFKFTNLQAAVGLGQLKKLSRRLKKSRQRDNWYREFLQDCPSVKFPGILKNNNGEITQWTDILVENREKLECVLKSHNIGYRCFWYPLHRQKPYLDKDNKYINAINISKSGLWLPSCFNITRGQVGYISGVIRDNLPKG
ncbi:MAG: DegT/DnrJ/EryC1/StrS family aminotransferase [Candidatus Omnitrophota bacterium]|nr:DegT/DnrJ/EryC1/StrS family aminotransferase [Candidatus Omnitrophota bacterium]